MKQSSRQDEEFSKSETERRREEALKRMLSTPHKPHTVGAKKGPGPVKRATAKKKSTSS